MINPQPEISESAKIAADVKIWAGTQVRENAEVGVATTIGQFCYVGPGVIIGKNCKIQNHALIYEPARLGDGVFIGPNVVIANDLHPRALNNSDQPKQSEDWKSEAATIEHGASLGAGVICVGPVNLGAWCMVAAGSVVTTDVPRYALVAGVPARQIGWVGEAGKRLLQKDGFFECPATNRRYELDSPTELIRHDE